MQNFGDVDDSRWEMQSSFIQLLLLVLSSVCMLLGIAAAGANDVTVQQRLALNLFSALQLSAVFGACFIALLMFTSRTTPWHEMVARYNGIMRLSAVSFGTSAAGFIVYLLIMMWFDASSHWSGLTVSTIASVVFGAMFCMVMIAIVQTKSVNK